jgi:hypothetical protein
VLKLITVELKGTTGRPWPKAPSLLQQVAQVTCVNFADVYPYNLAATSSARVTVYNSTSRRVNKTFARFKAGAYTRPLLSST